jgi:peptidylprolyl isomerase
VVRYLGQVYGGKKPFDENFSTGTPTSFAIGTGAVIKGWDQALVGATVGTRMVIAVPPDLGYGEEGNPDAGIKRTDTLYFVIDVLATA